MRELALATALLTGDVTQQTVLQPEPFECIARTVYAEARGEGTEGMALVVQSILNRREIQGRRSCWIANKAYDGYRLVKHRNPANFNADAWAHAQLVTIAVVTGQLELGACSGVTHFLNPRSVRRMPRWASRENRVCIVGNHHAYAVANI